MKSNKFAGAIASIVFAGNVLIPFAAMGATSGEMPDNMELGDKKPVVASCSFVTSHADIVKGRLTEMHGMLTAKREDRDKRLDAKRDNRVEKLDVLRALNDDHRSSLYAGLDARATTDAQKEAVVEFKSSIEAAVTGRKEAIDKANADFKIGIDKALAARKTKIDAAIATFEASVKSALDKAQADCETSDKKATARDASVVKKELQAKLKTSIDAAKAKLLIDQKAIEKISDSTKSLIEARSVAFDKAFTDFKAATERARVKLKAAFSA